MRQLSKRLHRRWSTMVDVRGPDDCWPWTGRLDAKGYGFIKVYDTTTRVHRVAWTLAHGAWPPAGQVVRHTCDYPACCNPAHLLLGTVRDNVRDCVERGRRARGERIYRTRFTPDDVRVIRSRVAAGERPRDVAADYGVTRQCIARIAERRTWGHVA